MLASGNEPGALSLLGAISEHQVFFLEELRAMAQKLYVGNLPFSATEEELRNLFSQYGEVQSVSIVTDRDTGRPRGFAFVEMENADEAIKKLDNQPMGGRNLKVNLAREREGGGRGGGGGGGGGGGRSRGGRW
jgi:RNA recognition motif-containing protein